jgi:hypothetical protein
MAIIKRSRIIEIIEIGYPKSLIQRQNELISELVETNNLIDELNLMLKPFVEQREQFYCVSSDSLVYGKPCNKWCGDENCKVLCK